MAQTYNAGRKLVPEFLFDEKQHRRILAVAVNQAMRGQSNNSLLVTLDPSVASTLVTDARISLQTACHMVAQTASAATEQASGNLYVVPEAGMATVFHTNSAVADRTFAMSLVG